MAINREEITLDRQATYLKNVVLALLGNEAYVATKYVSPHLVIRATRKIYRKYYRDANSKKKDLVVRKIDKHGNKEIILTIGKPNHSERKFIKDCKKAGEPFPVKGVILKFPPQPRRQK